MLIPLYRKQGISAGSIAAYAEVDSEDAEQGQYTWRLHSGYAARYENGQRVFLHRELCGLPRKYDGRQADHINRNRLDDRRENLRACSYGQNRQNAGSAPGASSGFRGVSWRKSHRRWEAYVKTGRKMYHLGLFHNEADAAEAARAKRAELLPFAVEEAA